MDVGTLIKNARLNKCLTQEELGELVGVKKSAVAKWETGRVSEIKRSHLGKLSAALGVSLAQLLDSVENPDFKSEECMKRIATVSERLIDIMTEEGIRQVDLCKATGIDKGSMNNYVHGRYEPKSDMLHKMAVALDVSEMWLYGYDVPKDRAEQKNNDTISDIVAQLNADEDYFLLIETVHKLAPEKRKVFADMLKAFAE